MPAAGRRRRAAVRVALAVVVTLWAALGWAVPGRAGGAERVTSVVHGAPAAGSAQPPTIPVQPKTLPAQPKTAPAQPTTVPSQPTTISAQPLTIPVRAEPDATAVSLDATVHVPPGGGRHPAVLLAHGFGGTKADLESRARLLAERGYVAIAYSARGFGASGGRIHLNAPEWEVSDARAIVDVLSRRPDVLLDGPGDPRVGVAGGSYGGALALMLAGADRRIDATVAAITWHDLADAFVPGGPDAAGGVFKRRWASLFFASTVAGDWAGPARAAGSPASERSAQSPPPTASTSAAAPPASPGSTAAPSTAAASPTLLCGRFDPTVCRLFLAAARTGTPSPELLTLLHRHSPAPGLATTRAPTLLVQGMRDSLFDLGQADATARTLLARGTPVAVRWFDGGHDSGAQPDDEATLLPWLDRYLAPAGAGRSGLPVPAFTAPVPAAGGERTVTTDRYPGLDGIDGSTSTLALRPTAADDRAGRILSPPGGDPAAISGAGALGGTGLGGGPGGGAGTAGADATGAASLAGYQLAALPGQSIAFDTDPVTSNVDIVGAPRVRLRVTSSARDATLFVSLWRMAGAGPTSPRGLVAPVRVATTPGTPIEVDVQLPAGTYSAATGSRWRVLVSATDAGFAVPTDARVYTVALADPRLRLPTAPGTATSSEGPDRETVGVAAALAALLLALALVTLLRARSRRRTDRRQTRAEFAGVPLVVEGLVKTYKDGHRAVDDVSWRAEAGQVVGLLGPNGAGKTTTMRMLVGLIRPDAGQVHVLGAPVHAGSPVLGRVGALIEGPGFLPHLSGRANLQAYWAATGRDPAEAGFAAALDVAALGDAVDRPVRTYSQGMRQRLGIAQAMLGRPDVLLLDEPTNGLDPPQIAAMRPILRAYAATGRTVVVSSHLLAEVEQTCTHVVVMDSGRVVMSGAIADLTGDATTIVQLEGLDRPDATPGASRAAGPAAAGGADQDELERVAAAVRAELGVDAHVRVDAPRRCLDVTWPGSRADIVAAVVGAGGRIAEVTGRRHLEEVFLGVIGQSAPANPAHPGDGRLDGRRGAPGADRPDTSAADPADPADPAGPAGTPGDGASTSPSDVDSEVDSDVESEEARMNRLRQVRRR